MELKNFFKLLVKHRYTLIAVPIVAIIITFFLVRNQPDVYSSQAQIATGIVDQTQQVLNDQGSLQESQISQEFSNLVAMIRSKKILDQLAYRLIIHDLTNAKPFRKPSKLMNTINDSARKHALEVYTDLYNKRLSLSLFNNDQNGLNKLIESMGYDNDAILKTLLVYRAEQSDFINIQYDAENPELSAFVVNTACKEFIDYYTLMVKENQNKAVTFLDRLLREKQDSLTAKTQALKQYKIKYRVLNLNEQAKSVYGQLSDYEGLREAAQKDKISTGAAINRIDNEFDPGNRQYSQNSYIKVNTQITDLEQQLAAANSAYIENNFDAAYKGRIDSINNILTSKIRLASDKYIYDPKAVKQDLVAQKLQLQTQNSIAANSIGPINKELGVLNKRLDGLVPHEAVVGAFEKAIEIAQQEYLTILEKYNQVSMEANYSIKLRQVVTAMPGLPQASKKMLLVMIFGVVSFVFCVVALFVIFFLDNSVKLPKELANATKAPVLGHLNQLDNSAIDFKKIWDTNEGSSKTQLFKNLLRSIRYEIDSEMAGSKVLLVNSLSEGEGKTLLSISLAYSRAIISQKVLLIDGNFQNANVTQTVKPQLYIEDYLKGTIGVEELKTTTMLNVWGNRGGDVSVFEIRSEEEVKRRFDELKSHFDIIIIEASALSTLNRSKEWVSVADKVVTVFESGQDITDGIKPGIAYLKGLKGKFIGWVLNKVPNLEASGKKGKS